MKCNLCGAENLTVRHNSLNDCLNFYKWYVGELYKQINKLKNDMPKGEQFLRCPIARDVKVRLFVEGKPTLKSWKHFQRVIQGMDDIFDDELPEEPKQSKVIGTCGHEIKTGLGNPVAYTENDSIIHATVCDDCLPNYQKLF